MPPKQKPGLQPISQDPEALALLESWCRKQHIRQPVKVLKAGCPHKFDGFTSQSLSKKMSAIFDSMWGSGNDGVKDMQNDPFIQSADVLMAAARNGNGVEDDKKMAAITPSALANAVSLSLLLSGDDNGMTSLHKPHKNMHILWIDVFPHTHDVQGLGPVDYVGVSMGAGEMDHPEGATAP